MKNLKRILSLALASTMLVGMMVVGAGAATFTDTEGNDHEAAIETMAALGIIKGRGNGVFDPDGNVSRAEMAKMIAVIMNKGVEFNYGTKVTPTFTDIKGHWAENYIEYCASFGIINGRGDGTFEPNGKVTATEAARMILNAMGNRIGATGSDWALNTEVNARDEANDLYGELDNVDINAPLSREQAAQMLCNALEAPVYDANGNTTTYQKVEYKDNVPTGKYVIKAGTDTTVTGAIKHLIDAGDTYASFAEAYIVASNSAKTDPTDADAEVAVKYGADYTIKPETEDDVKTVSTETQTVGSKYLSLASEETVLASVKATKNGYKANGTYVTAKNYADLLGQNVTVLYKLGKDGKVAKTYGITADNTAIYEGVYGKVAINSGKMTIGGVKYAVDSNTKFLVNGDETTAAAIKTEDLVKVTVNAGAKKVLTVMVTPVEVKQIRRLTATTINGLGETTKLSEVEGYTGMAKGDYVVMVSKNYTVSGKTQITKAATVSGKVEAIQGAKVRINGTWYTPAGNATVTTANLGDTFTLVLANGYYKQASQVTNTTTSTDLVILTKIAANPITSLDESYKQARAYFVATNTIEVINVPAGYTTEANANKLSTYKINDDGLYELTEVSSTNKAGYDSVETTGGHDYEKDTVNGVRLADSTTVVVVKSDKKVEVLNGKAVKAWKTNFTQTSGITTYVLTDMINGLEYASLVVLNGSTIPGLVGGGTEFGYVVSAPYKIKSGDTVYTTFQLWNGEKTISVLAPEATSVALGDVISYTGLDADGKVTAATSMMPGDGDKWRYRAILGYSKEDGLIRIHNGGDGNTDSTWEITNGTKILYIDSEAGTGEADGVITEADEFEPEDRADGDTKTYYTCNAMAWFNNDGTVKLLVIDVNNDMGITTNEQ